MPSVPYTGVPTVAPQMDATPNLSANTPPAAFGAATAEATSNLGRAVSGVGNELWQRATAMQDLFNHSQAIEADTKYMEAVGNIHAKLSSLQGKDAVDYFTNGFQQDLRGARQSIRDSLPNDMARKIFDQSSLSTMGRTVYSGAGYSATQNKKYAIGAAAAKVQTTRDAALIDPENDDAFQDHLEDTKDNVTAQYQLQGADPDTIEAAVHKAQSDLWYDRIQGLARSQPFAANKYLTQAVKDGAIRGEDVGKITNIVRDAMHTVGARNNASAIMSGGDLSWGAKPVSLGQAKLAIGTFESGNNYSTVGVPTSQGRALGRYQIMEANLPQWLKDSGLPPMSSAEFLKSPSAQDKVFETKFGAYMQQTGSFNDAASMWFSGRPMAQAGNARDALGTTVPKYIAATNAILAKNSSLADQVSRGRALADSQSPDDPLAADYTEAQIISQHNRQIAIKRDDTWNNTQIIAGAMVGGQDGKLPTTLDELKQKGPEVEAAWQKLPSTVQQRVLGQLAHNAKGDVVMTEDRLREYQRVKGLAQSAPSEFLDMDVVGLDLPMREKKELINLQQSKMKNAETDPRVTRALTILRPTMDAAGIDRRTNKDGYDRFVGALQDQLSNYSADNKKPADANSVQEIGQRLMRQMVTSKGWLWDSKSAVYSVDVPDSEKKQIVDAYQSRYGFPPSDDIIQRAYVAQVYDKLYGGKTKAQAAAPSGPKPPISQ